MSDIFYSRLTSFKDQKRFNSNITNVWIIIPTEEPFIWKNRLDKNNLPSKTGSKQEEGKSYFPLPNT